MAGASVEGRTARPETGAGAGVAVTTWRRPRNSSLVSGTPQLLVHEIDEVVATLRSIPLPLSPKRTDDDVEDVIAPVTRTLSRGRR